MFDLRIPSGWFFLIIGALLTGLGIFHPEARAPLTEFNANLYTGAGLLAFGALLLWLAKK